MATVARENIGLLNDKIVIKVSKEDYLPTFEKKIKDYTKTANIPGFRKGMVPIGMVKKMYGAAIYTDEVLKTVEKELYTYLDTEKPDIFAQPLALDADIRSMDFNNPSEYEFGFEIGLKPAFELASLSKAKLTLHKVKATDEQVQEEIVRMQIKGGKMTEPETIDNEENVLNVLFTESDKDGNAIEGGIEKENSVILKYFTPAIQKQLMGKKKDDTVVFQLSKSFDADKLEMMLQDLGFAKDNKEAADKFFKLTIVKIGLVEKRELNEEFFNEVFPGASIATEEEFRKKLKEEIEQYWAAQSRNQLQDQIYHFLLDETKMEFPAEFLKRWLQTGNAEQRKTAEEAEAEFPMFSNQLKWTLISDKIIKDNKLEVTADELKESMKAEVMRYFGTMNLGDDISWLDSYIDRMMKDEKQVDASYRRLVTEKLFSWAESQVKPTEKEVTGEELTAMQHNHQH
ncbi:trigger factor [Ferruginibacter lapsinanis]|uniref:trigger factor n=1 Tax=Ferruginibacter lapsinanis TaxID=563172 RepID=UPI001E46F320|nr:trigger factor [Ferruginibacter lapsinanis]UEG50388.1 trigger factor [Ferruginibacter lapsinanis]